jgi:hypothetical protein
VDEGHEVLCDDYAQKKTNFYIVRALPLDVSSRIVRATDARPFVRAQHAIDNLQSSYRWYVSGTPLPHARQSLVRTLVHHLSLVWLTTKL